MKLYVSTIGEERANSISHGVMTLLIFFYPLCFGVGISAWWSDGVGDNIDLLNFDI